MKTAKLPYLGRNLRLYASAFGDLREGKRLSSLPQKLTPYESMQVLRMAYYAYARARHSYPETEEHRRLQRAQSLAGSQFARHVNGGYDHFMLDREAHTNPMDVGIMWNDERLRGYVFDEVHRRFDKGLQEDPTGVRAIRDLSDNFGFSSLVDLVTGIRGSDFQRLLDDYEMLVGTRELGEYVQ